MKTASENRRGKKEPPSGIILGNTQKRKGVASIKKI